MSEVAETLTRKKKGRPSLLDLQKRAIKQQQLQKFHDDHRSAPKNPNSLNSGSRSKCRNPNRNRVSSDDDEDEEDDDERREKKHRLLRGLNTHSRRHSPNSKPGGAAHGSGYTVAFQIALDPNLGFKLGKDMYGVYSDPVDPEELPDYHDIIENPMDFSTLQKKLDSDSYRKFSDTIEKLALEDIWNAFKSHRLYKSWRKSTSRILRQDSDDEEPQTQQQQQQQHQHQLKVAERGRPPKKQPEPSCLDRTTSEISADDALNPGGDSSSKFSGAYNLRRTSVRINHDSETQSGCSQDWENEFPPSVVKAVNKYGLKHFDVDDNRRETYNHLSTSTQEPWVLTTLEDELKELIPVGLNTEYGYTRSLARYGANLGPLAWKIVSRRIETALPAGIKFGLGWVGEDDPPKQTLLVWSLGKHKCSNDHSDRVMSPTASVSSAFIGNRHSSSQGIKETAPARVLNRETEFPSSSSSRQSEQLIKPERSNGLIRGADLFVRSTASQV
ncbi:hypothetical protein YC2023_090335 [Brassica napus]